MNRPEHAAPLGPTLRNLLVPLDGSGLAEAVLPAVRELARRFGARITLLHVLERGAPKTVHGQSHLVDEPGAAAYLDRVARDFSDEGLPVEVHVHPDQERSVISSLVDHAHELGGDLVVLATHGPGGLRDLVAGSVAEQVVGRGAAPVLLIRPEWAAAQGAFRVRRLLVPLDGTPDSERALPLAEAVACAWEAEIVLVRVVPTSGSLQGNQAAVAVMLPSATKAALDEEHETALGYLRRLSRGLVDRGLATTEEVLRGEPTATIVVEAHRLDADLVVMATHGRSGLDAFWSSSIGHRLSERLSMPLLVLRSERSGQVSS